jgi:hypothetical protein
MKKKNYSYSDQSLCFNSLMQVAVLSLCCCCCFFPVDYFHIPAVVSFPHFYMADPTVIESVIGVSPNAEQHQTTVDVEPVGACKD